MKVYGLVRFVKEPELKKVGDNSMLKSTVAWNDYKGVGSFVDIVAWRKTAERMADCKKGDRLFIESGTLSDNNYQGKEGMVYQKLVTVNEFKYIEPKSDSNKPFTQEQPKEERNFKEEWIDPNNLHPKKDVPVLDVTEDDLPF